MPAIFLQEVEYLCSSQFCPKVAVPEGESDSYCKAEYQISKNDCLHSRLVLISRVESRHLNLRSFSIHSSIIFEILFAGNW